MPVLAEVLDELPWLPARHTSFSSVLQQLGPAALCGTASGVSQVPLHVQGCRRGTEVVIFPVSAVQGGAVSANS